MTYVLSSPFEPTLDEVSAALTLATRDKVIRSDDDEARDGVEQDLSGDETEAALRNLPPEDLERMMAEVAPEAVEHELPEPAAFRPVQTNPTVAVEVSLDALLSAPASDDPLQALLDESLAAVAARKNLRNERQRLAVSGDSLSVGERERLRAKILAWETEEEWTPQFAVMVVNRQRCLCCFKTLPSVAGMFELQVSNKLHRSKAQSQVTRWVRWSPQTFDNGIEKLPRRIAYRLQEVAACPECAVANLFLEEVVCDW